MPVNSGGVCSNRLTMIRLRYPCPTHVEMIYPSSRNISSPAMSNPYLPGPVGQLCFPHLLPPPFFPILFVLRPLFQVELILDFPSLCPFIEVRLSLISPLLFMLLTLYMQITLFDRVPIPHSLGGISALFFLSNLTYTLSLSLNF